VPLTVLLAILFGFTLFVGVLIGSIGIGGVLLVPMLTYLGGIEIHTAIAVAMFSYLFTGAVGATVYARRRSIRWPMAIWLCAGAMPAAFAGSWLTNLLPGHVLEIIIAVFVIFSGANALRPDHAGAVENSALDGRVNLLLIGVVTGLGSAMSGTGGPLLLVPILIWLKVPVLTAIGLSQAIQLPIATLATAGNLIYGQLDFLFGAVVAAGLTAGSFAGAHAAHMVSQAVLKRVVAVVLIAVGLYIAGRIAYSLLAGAPPG
jgi:uncharacterized membrane protein YfcA